MAKNIHLEKFQRPLNAKNGLLHFLAAGIVLLFFPEAAAPQVHHYGKHRASVHRCRIAYAFMHMHIDSRQKA